MKNPVEQLSSKITSMGMTLSIAESVTGGMLSAALTSMPGASSFFRGAVIAYCSSAKQSILGVSGKTIAEFGQVSSRVAGEMAAGVAGIMKTDIAIATTGLAGPEGDGSPNPIGLCFIAVSLKGRTCSKRALYSGGRDDIRRSCTADALLYCSKLLGESLPRRSTPIRKK